MSVTRGAAGGSFPGRVRIVAGSRRGRYIKVPQKHTVRPTSDMVRQAVFNVLGPIGDLAVLDLFAGSGALGLEALSRGARSCLFVESDPTVARILSDNIVSLEYEAAAKIVVADYKKALERLVTAGTCFDLLFVDPPYRILEEVEGVLSVLVPRVMTHDGVVVIESDSSSQASLGLTPVFARIYGDTKITMAVTRRSLD